MDGEKKIVTYKRPRDRPSHQNSVDISVLPQSDEGFWFKAASSLFFPSAAISWLILAKALSSKR